MFPFTPFGVKGNTIGVKGNISIKVNFRENTIYYLIRIIMSV